MEENLLTITTNPVSTPELSEEEEWDGDTSELTGTLNKWTNYIHGWQKRFMAIKVRLKLFRSITHVSIVECEYSINIIDVRTALWCTTSQRARQTSDAAAPSASARPW